MAPLFCSAQSTTDFLGATRSIEPNSYGNVAVWVAGWLAGWLAVCHSQYCIKTTKPILKLFGPSGSPIILGGPTKVKPTYIFVSKI